MPPPPSVARALDVGRRVDRAAGQMRRDLIRSGAAPQQASTPKVSSQDKKCVGQWHRKSITEALVCQPCGLLGSDQQLSIVLWQAKEDTLRSVLCASLSWPSQILITSTDVRVLCCEILQDPQASRENLTWSPHSVAPPPPPGPTTHTPTDISRTIHTQRLERESQEASFSMYSTDATTTASESGRAARSRGAARPTGGPSPRARRQEAAITAEVCLPRCNTSSTM
jgi:type II secretory pathway component PulJ